MSGSKAGCVEVEVVVPKKILRPDPTPLVEVAGQMVQDSWGIGQRHGCCKHPPF